VFPVRYELNRLNITVLLGLGFEGLKDFLTEGGTQLSVQTPRCHKMSVTYKKFIYAFVYILYTCKYIAYDEKGSACGKHTIKL
jgi:hypothetical protein